MVGEDSFLLGILDLLLCLLGLLVSSWTMVAARVRLGLEEEEEEPRELVLARPESASTFSFVSCSSNQLSYWCS